MWSVHTIVAAYQWLELNNLWKATVAFSVTVLLSGVLTFAARPWRAWQQFQEHKAAQLKIADQLDTTTPGGLTDLLDALYRVLGDVQEDPPDDNGTDMPSFRKKGSGHGSHAEARPDHDLPVHNFPMHGGGAGHGR